MIATVESRMDELMELHVRLTSDWSKPWDADGALTPEARKWKYDAARCGVERAALMAAGVDVHGEVARRFGKSEAQIEACASKLAALIRQAKER
jgi:hypothetical protein